VTRTGGANQAVTVNFATQDGINTLAGFNYVATNGTLAFAAGEIAKSFRFRFSTTARPILAFFFNVKLTTSIRRASRLSDQCLVNIRDALTDDRPPWFAGCYSGSEHRDER